MVMCGPGGGRVDRSGSDRSIIPRRLFGNYEGDSRTMIDEESHGTRSSETTRPEPPCATEDTEEGRKNRIEAWVAKATTQDTAWESNEELSYQDQDVRLKRPEQANSHVTTASQRRSELKMDLPSGRRASIASRRTDRGPDPTSGRRSSVASEVAEPNLASQQRSELSVDLHPRRRASTASRRTDRSPDYRPGRRSSVASEVAEPNLASQWRSNLSVDLHSRRKSSVASRRTDPSPDPKEGRRLSVVSGVAESNLAFQSRRSRLVSPEGEKTYPARRQLEESSFTHQSRRRLSPVPQREPIMSHTEPPAAARYDWEIDRADPSVRPRMRTEPPSSPPHESTTPFRRNRASRHSVETPCIHIDPPRASRSRYESYGSSRGRGPPLDPCNEQPQSRGKRDSIETAEHPSTRHVRRDIIRAFGQTTASRPTLRNPET